MKNKNRQTWILQNLMAATLLLTVGANQALADEDTEHYVNRDGRCRVTVDKNPNSLLYGVYYDGSKQWGMFEISNDYNSGSSTHCSDTATTITRTINQNSSEVSLVCEENKKYENDIPTRGRVYIELDSNNKPTAIAVKGEVKNGLFGRWRTDIDVNCTDLKKQ